jgi:TolB-like protein
VRARSFILCAALGMLVQTASLAGAQPAKASPEDDLLLSTGAIDARIAVTGFDALGLDAERVARLESLFRMELDRLSRHPIPSARTVKTTIQSSRELRRCSGENSCLARIGQALGVDVVVSGSVAALGDSYILNIKVVSASAGTELQRLTTEPLRGNPDELIEAMRVAAYRLLAPEQLLGSISVLSDLVGARVLLDGKEVGATPLPRPIYKLALGEHELRVEARGYVPFVEKVEVRFQKTTRVVVRLATREGAAGGAGGSLVRKRAAPTPWYTSTWFYVGVGVAAGVVGGIVGYQLAHDPVIDCGARPDACIAR